MRSTLTWLLALVMPFQVLTAVYLDTRGPMHFHLASGHGEHRHDRAPERGSNPDYGHYLPHFHGQQQPERHHHSHDATVVAVESAGLLAPFAPREDTTSGWSGIMLLALLATAALLWLPGIARDPTPEPRSAFLSRLPARLERPPRLKLA